MNAWWERIRQGEMALTVTVVAAVAIILIVFYRRHRRYVAAEALAAKIAEDLASKPASLSDDHENGALTNGSTGKGAAFPKAGKHG
jgi:hypothetical protein